MDFFFCKGDNPKTDYFFLLRINFLINSCFTVLEFTIKLVDSLSDNGTNK